MYSQFLAYFHTNYKLACYGMAIAGWYSILAGHAGAQTSPVESSTDWVNSENIVNPIQLSSATNTHRDLAGEDDEDRSESPTTNSPVKPQVAQGPTTITLPSANSPAVISPTILPSLIPQSTQYIPLNSILNKDLIPTPNNTPAVRSDNAPNDSKPASTKDPRYLIAPKELNPQIVDPFSTQFVLNGNRVSHLTATVATTGYEVGNFRTSDFRFDVYRLIGAKNVQSVTSDGIVRVNTKLDVAGIKSVVQNQSISVSTTQPQTLLGFRQQISLDGSCLDGSSQTCTFLPGIVIDDSVTDQKKLQPTGVKITSQFGDVIDPTSVTAIRTDGFQGGANGATTYGLDLTIPAVGVVSPAAGTTTTLTGERKETIDTTVAVNYTQLNQDFATNGVESSLGRTIRSLNYIHKDNNQILNAAVAALGQVLPEIKSPNIAPGKSGAKIVVNPNLYRAANFVRIPENSQTVYQGGTGYAASFGSDTKVPPGAKHLAVWVGLSPVVERKFTKDYSYVTLSAPRIVSTGGGEGGSVPIDVNLNGTNFNSSSLSNVYGQGYLTVLNRDVNRVDVETISQRTDYFPHISLTGTSLTDNSLWRYFTGAIFNTGFESTKTDRHVKAYVGTDYSIVNPRGFSFTVGGVGYVNPDPEYYSQLFTTASQSIGLGSNPRNSIVIGATANYTIDGTIKIQSLPVRATQSYVNAGLALNLGDVSIGGTQYFGNLLSESIDNKTIFNVNWKVNNRLKVGAFVSAFDRNISTSPFGGSLSYDLDPNSNSTLYLGWNAAEIDFRRTLGATSNVYKDNTVSVSLKYGF
jgi:hypothetical protein